MQLQTADGPHVVHATSTAACSASAFWLPSTRIITLRHPAMYQHRQSGHILAPDCIVIKETRVRDASVMSQGFDRVREAREDAGSLNAI